MLQYRQPKSKIMYFYLGFGGNSVPLFESGQSMGGRKPGKRGGKRHVPIVQNQGRRLRRTPAQYISWSQFKGSLSE